MCSTRKGKNEKFWKKIALVELIVSVIAIIIVYLMGTGFIHPPIEKSDVHAYEDIYRFNDTQSYRLIITNTGEKFSMNLRVEIVFPTNMTIFEIPYDESFSGQQTNVTGGKDTYFYKVEYSTINVNQTIKIQLLLHNNVGEFKINDSWIVSPKTVHIWADGNEISIS